VSDDPRSPDFDDRCYCEHCLVLLSEDWLREHAIDGGECPRCKRYSIRTIRFDEMQFERALRRADAGRE
jgi:hypothetical protein